MEQGLALIIHYNLQMFVSIALVRIILPGSEKMPNELNDERVASQVCYFILALANLLRRFATQQAMP